MKTKKCTKCQLEKEIIFFYKKEPNSERYSNLCKPCEKERQRGNKKYFPPSDLEGEIWKDVVNYEGLYQVSNLNRLKGVRRIIKNKLKGDCLLEERIISIKPDNVGYFACVLSNGKNKKTFKVHRLIAEAFIPNPENKPCVNHINGVKDDNRLENLEWVTYSENTKHAFDTGLMKTTKGDECSWSKVNEQQVLEIRKSKGIVSYSKMSEKYGISITTISNIINKKSWKHI